MSHHIAMSTLEYTYYPRFPLSIARLSRTTLPLASFCRRSNLYNIAGKRPVRPVTWDKELAFGSFHKSEATTVKVYDATGIAARCAPGVSPLSAHG
jgi:hypothetical protein